MILSSSVIELGVSSLTTFTFMYYVYLIKNEKNEIYTGCTSDLRKRIAEYN